MRNTILKLCTSLVFCTLASAFLFSAGAFASPITAAQNDHCNHSCPNHQHNHQQHDHQHNHYQHGVDTFAQVLNTTVTLNNTTPTATVTIPLVPAGNYIVNTSIIATNTDGDLGGIVCTVYFNGVPNTYPAIGSATLAPGQYVTIPITDAGVLATPGSISTECVAANNQTIVVQVGSSITATKVDTINGVNPCAAINGNDSMIADTHQGC